MLFRIKILNIAAIIFIVKIIESDYFVNYSIRDLDQRAASNDFQRANNNDKELQNIKQAVSLFGQDDEVDLTNVTHQDFWNDFYLAHVTINRQLIFIKILSKKGNMYLLFEEGWNINAQEIKLTFYKTFQANTNFNVYIYHDQTQNYNPIQVIVTQSGELKTAYYICHEQSLANAPCWDPNWRNPIGYAKQIPLATIGAYTDTFTHIENSLIQNQNQEILTNFANDFSIRTIEANQTYYTSLQYVIRITDLNDKIKLMQIGNPRQNVNLTTGRDIFLNGKFENNSIYVFLYRYNNPSHEYFFTTQDINNHNLYVSFSGQLNGPYNYHKKIQIINLFPNIALFYQIISFQQIQDIAIQLNIKSVLAGENLILIIKRIGSHSVSFSTPYLTKENGINMFNTQFLHIKYNLDYYNKIQYFQKYDQDNPIVFKQLEFPIATITQFLSIQKQKIISKATSLEVRIYNQHYIYLDGPKDNQKLVFEPIYNQKLPRFDISLKKYVQISSIKNILLLYKGYIVISQSNNLIFQQINGKKQYKYEQLTDTSQQWYLLSNQILQLIIDMIYEIETNLESWEEKNKAFISIFKSIEQILLRDDNQKIESYITQIFGNFWGTVIVLFEDQQNNVRIYFQKFQYEDQEIVQYQTKNAYSYLNSDKCEIDIQYDILVFICSKNSFIYVLSHSMKIEYHKGSILQITKINEILFCILFQENGVKVNCYYMNSNIHYQEYQTESLQINLKDVSRKQIQMIALFNQSGQLEIFVSIDRKLDKNKGYKSDIYIFQIVIGTLSYTQNQTLRNSFIQLKQKNLVGDIINQTVMLKERVQKDNINHYILSIDLTIKKTPNINQKSDILKTSFKCTNDVTLSFYSSRKTCQVQIEYWEQSSKIHTKVWLDKIDHPCIQPKMVVNRVNEHNISNKLYTNRFMFTLSSLTEQNTAIYTVLLSQTTQDQSFIEATDIWLDKQSTSIQQIFFKQKEKSFDLGILFADGRLMYKESISSFDDLIPDENSIEINCLGLGIIPLGFQIYNYENKRLLVIYNDFVYLGLNHIQQVFEKDLTRFSSHIRYTKRQNLYSDFTQIDTNGLYLQSIVHHNTQWIIADLNLYQIIRKISDGQLYLEKLDLKDFDQQYWLLEVPQSQIEGPKKTKNSDQNPVVLYEQNQYAFYYYINSYEISFTLPLNYKFIFKILENNQNQSQRAESSIDDIEQIGRILALIRKPKTNQ